METKALNCWTSCLRSAYSFASTNWKMAFGTHGSCHGTFPTRFQSLVHFLEHLCYVLVSGAFRTYICMYPCSRHLRKSWRSRRLFLEKMPLFSCRRCNIPCQVDVFCTAEVEHNQAGGVWLPAVRWYSVIISGSRVGKILCQGNCTRAVKAICFVVVVAASTISTYTCCT